MKFHKVLITLLIIFCLAGCTKDVTPEINTVIEATQVELIEDVESVVESEPVTEETESLEEIILPEANDEDFVRVKAYIPDIFVELRYSTENNFTGQKIYDFLDVWLRYGTVKKLILVQEELKEQGLSLKIWDGFRPTAAQFKLWEVCPDAKYVANPNNGFSSHSRGNTVDITLVNLDGSELIMPTGFDDFSKLADRDYSDCSEEATNNSLLLENLMKKHGFKPYSQEWWHFSDTDSYDVEKTFDPAQMGENDIIYS
jgi:D-alanyl-D-alanine dipeptidase